VVAPSGPLDKTLTAIWLSYAILSGSRLAAIALSFISKKNLQILIGQFTELGNALLNYRVRKRTVPRHLHLELCW
jgi:hypothetical protein